MSSYNGVEALRPVHFIVHNAQSSVRFQHTVRSFHILPIPVFPPVVDDTWRGIIDGISVMVLHLRTRQLLKAWILGRNLRRPPPVFVSQFFFFNAALTNMILYKVEICLQSSHSSPKILEHSLTVRRRTPYFGDLEGTCANKVPQMSPKLTEDMQTNRSHPYKRLNLFWTSCRVQLKCDGARWRTGGEVKGKLANGVDSQYP